MTGEPLTDLEREVLDALDEDALVESLIDLVRIPSVGGADDELAVQEHAAEVLRTLDTDVDRWDIDLDELRADPWFPGEEVDRAAAIGVVGTTAGEGQPGLILSGHLDVVPPGDVDTWHGTDPFSAEIRDGALYGRGACDMKGGVAANLAVVRTLRDAGVRLERPVAVHAVVGEEDGGLGAFATLRRGHRGDVAVITEPTGAKLITATAGALTFRIEVTGRSAHGSMRKEGVSAWEAFLPVYRALVDLEAERNARPDREFVGEVPYALSFGILKAGEWSSSVPDKLVAEGRYGVQIGEDPNTARIAFEDVVNDVAVKDPWLHDHRPVVTWPGGQFASGWLDEGHSLVDEMTDAVTALGKPSPAQAAGVYGSDLRLYTGIGGVPSLHYGPGDFRLAHAPMESVDLQELADVTRALLLLAMRRCGAHR